jgi:hypothetical protein
MGCPYRKNEGQKLPKVVTILHWSPGERKKTGRRPYNSETDNYGIWSFASQRLWKIINVETKIWKAHNGTKPRKTRTSGFCT